MSTTDEDRSDKLREVLDDYGKPDDKDIGTLPKGGAQLTYVGHAAVTRMLIEADPLWEWEPYALDEAGLPLVTFAKAAKEKQPDTAEMWIKLTVHGKTLPAIGTCPANADERSKQLISDALRNGAMRFGIALSLWSKEEWAEGPPAEDLVTVAGLKGAIREEVAGLRPDLDGDTLAAVLRAAWEDASPGPGPWPVSEAEDWRTSIAALALGAPRSPGDEVEDNGVSAYDEQPFE